jgi:hypothetical protein
MMSRTGVAKSRPTVALKSRSADGNFLVALEAEISPN